MTNTSTLRERIAAHCRATIISCQSGYPISAANEARAILAILDAHPEQPAPAAVAEAPTDGQLVSACLSYDHRYGLMDPEQRDRLHFQCREWWRSIARAINDGDRP